MGYRINERNAGHWTLDGEPKQRLRKVLTSKTLSANEKYMLLHVLERVIDCMEFDPDLSDVGHLHPEAKFSDGGRFLLCMSRKEFEELGTLYEKIEKI